MVSRGCSVVIQNMLMPTLENLAHLFYDICVLSCNQWFEYQIHKLKHLEVIVILRIVKF